MLPHTDSAVPKVNKPLFKIDPWLIALIAFFLLFAWACWGKIDSPLIDVGREVEISARILSGQVIYRDIATYYGPLAYYANALALLLFGQRLEVFFAVGTGLALLGTLLFYRLAKRLMDAPWAAVSTSFMVIYCAVGSGLFYFVIPYSYGAAYAIVLCLLAITALDYYVSNGRIIWLVVAAIACGLAGCAKQEYGVAAFVSLLVGTNLYFPQNLRTRVERNLLIVTLAGGSCIIPYALIAQQSSWETVLSFLFPVSDINIIKRSALFSISPLKTLVSYYNPLKAFLGGSVIVLLSTITAQRISKKYIRASLPPSLRTLLELLVSFALVLFSLKLIARIFQLTYNATGTQLFKKIALTVISAGDPLGNLCWSIPIIVCWFAVNRPQEPRYKAAPLMWILLVFTLFLNIRWLYNITFYGLYAPPLLLLFFTVFYHLTERIKHIKIQKMAWSYLVVCVLVGSTLYLQNFQPYQYSLTSSRGTFTTVDDSIVDALKQTIKFIEASKATSVLVLPEGNIINFLTGTHSPSRELTFLPVALPHAKDEQNFVERMQSNPPQLIVFVPRSFEEWNYKSYAEFNPIVDRWVTKQHKLIYSIPMDKDTIQIYAGN